MGCGGSKNEILEGCEKPLCHIMEKVDINEIDDCFSTTSRNICLIEEKRKLLVDECMDNFYHTGAIVYKTPGPQNAIDACIWRLGKDNKGKVAEIGFNSETMCFEGSGNSEQGNMVANQFIGYMKCLAEQKPDDFIALCSEHAENVNGITSNMDKYMTDIKEKYSSEPMDGMKCCNSLKVNLAKATTALNCMNGLKDKLMMVVECAPKMMEKCNPEKFQEEQANVDKAVASKATCNLSIAWAVVEAAERKPKTCKQIMACYAEKVACRNKILGMMAGAK